MLLDPEDVSEAQFMESFESRHSDQDFTFRLAKKLGVTKAPLRLDSQTKYGDLSSWYNLQDSFNIDMHKSLCSWERK